MSSILLQSLQYRLCNICWKSSFIEICIFHSFELIVKTIIERDLSTAYIKIKCLLKKNCNTNYIWFVNKSIHIFWFADSYRIIHQALSLAQGVANIVKHLCLHSIKTHCFSFSKCLTKIAIFSDNYYFYHYYDLFYFKHHTICM